MESVTLKADRVLIHGFFEHYPSEAAGYLDRLPSKEVLRLLRAETIEVSAKIFVHINPEVTDKILAQRDETFFSNLFTALDPEQGAVILSCLDEDLIQDRLVLLPEKLAKEYRELMRYPPDTAGFLMDPRAVTFKAENTIEEVLSVIRNIAQRRIIDVCVVDEDGILIGIVPLQPVAVAQPAQRLEELLQRDPVTVNMLDHKEEAVKLLEDRKLATLPVVNLDGILLGVIRHDALVTAAQQEATEDLLAMFGAGRDEHGPLEGVLRHFKAPALATSQSRHRLFGGDGRRPFRGHHRPLHGPGRVFARGRRSVRQHRFANLGGDPARPGLARNSHAPLVKGRGQRSRRGFYQRPCRLTHHGTHRLLVDVLHGLGLCHRRPLGRGHPDRPAIHRSEPGAILLHYFNHRDRRRRLHELLGSGDPLRRHAPDCLNPHR